MPRQRAVPRARNGSENGQVQKKKPNTDGPEITWTRTMMDQNNYGLFGIFFFYGPIFLVHNFSKDGIIFLINCWSSVVASVVLPQFCNVHCPFYPSFCGFVLFFGTEKKSSFLRNSAFLFICALFIDGLVPPFLCSLGN